MIQRVITRATALESLSLRFLKVLLTLALMLSAPVPIRAQTKDDPRPASGQAALVLRDLQGREQDLRDYRGSIVLVNFWATWCVPCREEMPIFVSLQKRYAERGVRFIAVSIDDPKNKEAVSRFARDLGVNFPVWVGATIQEMRRLGLGEALPATAVVDREGRIVGRILGPVDKRDLTKRIRWLLNAPSPLVDKISEAVQDDAGNHSHPHDRQRESDDARDRNDEGDAAGPSHEGHEHGEEHQHGGVGMEGASLVPS